MAAHGTGSAAKRRDIARRIADELAGAGVRMVASLPDNWITEVITKIDGDLASATCRSIAKSPPSDCAQAPTWAAMGSAALMGASGLMTVIYAITKINYSYEIPLLMLITLRGAFGDHHKHHISNGLYLQPVLEAISHAVHASSTRPRTSARSAAPITHSAYLLPPNRRRVDARLTTLERTMQYLDCFRFLAARRTDRAGRHLRRQFRPGLVGSDRRDTETAFYLDASMSLSTMFASGLATALPQIKIWAFMGDGAFCMNPGMLMVERQMNLPNLTHFLVSNRAYGATSNAALAEQRRQRLRGDCARGIGLERVFEFDNLEDLGSAASTPRCWRTRPATRLSCSKSSRFRMQSRNSSSRRSTRRIEISIWPHGRAPRRRQGVRLSGVARLAL